MDGLSKRFVILVALWLGGPGVARAQLPPCPEPIESCSLPSPANGSPRALWDAVGQTGYGHRAVRLEGPDGTFIARP
jgi:hypothetical protein